MCDYVIAHYFASVGVFLYTLHSHDYRQTVTTGGGSRVERKAGKKRKEKKKQKSSKIEINNKDYRD